MIDDMICDYLVLGIKDIVLRGRMLREVDLILDKVIIMCLISERILL